MQLEDMIASANEVREAYADLHARNERPQWGAVEYAQGFVGDVGDLMKLVMAKGGFRYADDVDTRLAHELCDCLWSVLVLANEFGIDLGQEFPRQMDALLRRISSE